ncbi:hypothetical protein ASE86_02250 [Sphingomonas sp. Leaf33]|uniref:hypothetical protein n=1 Tax=Sphingomonas sp. Leaf33 TaxID=1736215 RepID=UPI0007004216|nr:hypothetical protein [Sphingomonas sp. Leaf33]KQN25103.1 hypothetical protein ASE86_02250 [Sphingomonas sp. Leaf33]
MIKVVVDRSHALVNLTADGFVTDADIATGAAQLHAAIRSLGDRMGRHVTLYDLTGLRVASPAILDTFAVFFTDPAYRAIWARRVAFVTASPLVTLQMERIRRDRPDMQVFAERAPAIAWLFAVPERGQAAA